MLWLFLIAAAAPLRVHVIVPLCDRAVIDCGGGAAGDPHSLAGNLYWGAAFGAEHFLSHAAGLRVVATRDQPVPTQPGLLREVQLARDGARDESALTVRLRAYADIDLALADFFEEASGKSDADLVVWAGHDRLMDVAPPAIAPGGGKPVAVLACSSQTYFGPSLTRAGAHPVALTRTFMAPEAYLIEALLSVVATDGVNQPAAIRRALIAAYAKYQKISLKAAASVFAVL